VPDHAITQIASGSKLGPDATEKTPGEGYKRLFRPSLAKTEAVVKAKVKKIQGKALNQSPYECNHAKQKNSQDKVAQTNSIKLGLVFRDG